MIIRFKKKKTKKKRNNAGSQAGLIRMAHIISTHHHWEKYLLLTRDLSQLLYLHLPVNYFVHSLLAEKQD